jgi:prepilin-type N-terminal cleavage/methylation domain-containing protein
MLLDGKMREKAFTMIELMVALGLMGFLLAGLYGLVTLGFRHAREAEVFETVHSEALVAVSKIRREIALTSFASVSDLSSSPDFVIFASPQKPLGAPDHQVYSYDANGNLEWHKWVCFFRDASAGTVVRAEIPFTPPVNAPPTAPPPIGDFLALTDPTAHRIIGRNCSALRFEQGTAVLGSVRVSVETAKLINSEDQTVLNLVDDVKPRNEP